MKLFCMCHLTGPGLYESGPVLDGQVYLAPNRWVPVPKERLEKGYGVALSRPMNVLDTDVPRLKMNHDKDIANYHPNGPKKKKLDRERLMDSSRQGPNVTVYHCSRCGAKVILEV